MRIYKLSIVGDFFMIFGIVFLSYLIFILFNIQLNFLQRLLYIIAIPLGFYGIYVCYSLRVGVDNNGVSVFFVHPGSAIRPKKDKVSSFLAWDEIESLGSWYILNPDSPIITLKPKIGIKKKRIEIALGFLPNELLKDILAHISPDTKVNLYPYLYKLSKRKPDSIRKIIIIGFLLVLMIIVGFLLAWFHLKIGNFSIF